jgi:hypothetical protein
MAVGGVALALGLAGPGSAGVPQPLLECLDSAEKFEDHPQGGPPGVVRQLESEQGGLNTSGATPGGQALWATVISDAGGGNGGEFDCLSDDPGNSGNTPGSESD